MPEQEKPWFLQKTEKPKKQEERPWFLKNKPTAAPHPFTEETGEEFEYENVLERCRALVLEEGNLRKQEDALQRTRKQQEEDNLRLLEIQLQLELLRDHIDRHWAWLEELQRQRLERLRARERERDRDRDYGPSR